MAEEPYQWEPYPGYGSTSGEQTPLEEELDRVGDLQQADYGNFFDHAAPAGLDDASGALAKPLLLRQPLRLCAAPAEPQYDMAVDVDPSLLELGFDATSAPPPAEPQYELDPALFA